MSHINVKSIEDLSKLSQLRYKLEHLGNLFCGSEIKHENCAKWNICRHARNGTLASCDFVIVISNVSTLFSSLTNTFQTFLHLWEKSHIYESCEFCTPSPFYRKIFSIQRYYQPTWPANFWLFQSVFIGRAFSWYWLPISSLNILLLHKGR